MFSQDEDQDQKVVLIVVATLVSLIIAGVITFSAISGSSTEKAPDTATTTSATEASKNANSTTAVVPLMLNDNESKVIVENGVVKFYFASGKADLAAGANEALADIIKGLKAGQKATISGYHDSTGDPLKNAELAKQRATTVRDAIIALGVAPDTVELKKPEQMEIKGNNAQARRVEVTLVK